MHTDRRDEHQAAAHQRLSGPDSGEEPNGSPAQATVSSALHDADPASNSLLAPVHVPEDPAAVLDSQHPAASILASSSLVVQRQLELLNVLVGFKQANRHALLDARGMHVGYMAEQDDGAGAAIARQWAGTHRSAVTWVFNRHGKEVLRFHRPFSFLTSKIRVYDPLHAADPSRCTHGSAAAASYTSVAGPQGPGAQVSSLPMEEMQAVGEAHQVWHLFRR
ncbi:hypothetical protein KEM52_003834, partial [Ascosphaera acerosa]